MTIYKISIVLSFVFTQFALAESSGWPQFRGMGATSYQPQSNPPIRFDGSSGDNIQWKVDLPGRSVSGPIVVDGQVISTSSGGMDQRRIFITSVSEATGEVLWEQNLVARGRPFCHPYSANAAPTPASDGQRIFAFYSSNDLVAFNLQGEPLWYRSLASEFPKAGNDTGMSSSPMVIDGTVVVQVECQGDSFAAGYETASGKLLWKLERPHEANWSSPTPWIMKGLPSLVVLTSAIDVTIIHARTGEKVAVFNKGASTISSALCVDDRLFIANQGLTSLRWNSHGNMLDKLWASNKLEPGNSSPIVVGSSVVVLKSGVLTVGDVDNGSIRYKMRLPDCGSIWSTPVICQEHLYVFSDTGRCFVVSIGEDSAKVIATNELGELVLGSPAVCGDAIYVRSETRLWKIAQKP